MLPDLVLYGGFAVVVTVLLAIDLLVVHRDSHEVSLKEAGTWSAIWIGCAVLFGLFVARLHAGVEGEDVTLAYFTGYVIEKSLSVDNVFLFVLIFGALAVPKHLQHRVLFYGVLGAIVMRTVLIFTGAALIERFDWILYLFGAFLLYTGIQTWVQRNEHPDITDSKMLARIKRTFPTTPDYHGQHFFVRVQGRLLATPMFIVLVLVEFTDLIFAMDSIPAVFAVTRDPFIVLTSNIFAILGLRALYFLLAGVADKLRYLKAGLAIILAYVGVKLIYERLHDDVEGIHAWPAVDPLVSLAIIMGILGVAVVASLRHPLGPGEEAPAGVGPFERHREREHR
ncbi:MAG: TerC/Alx family metal homeostasis membrane protein [Nitriliruptorales bacterium]|nr:TerC/Alx family metal homeostasis membrane protein [Nitriliruptorales bacterium]